MDKARILEGKPVAEALKTKLAERIRALDAAGITPTLLLIRVGEREDDIFYERSIIKACSQAGITSLSEMLDANASQSELLSIIKKANTDNKIHGIMVFKPLPSHMREEVLSAAIAPQKDVDCISDENVLKVFAGNASLYPCTPQAVVTLLKHYGIPLSGGNVTVVGRGMVVGKPLSMLLLSQNATVTVCHSKTKELKRHTKNADIVIAAIGRPKLFGKEYFSESSIVIDVGVNTDDTGNMCGDVDFEDVKDYVAAITPAKGGVGAVTTITLLSNAVHACEIQNGRNNNA